MPDWITFLISLAAALLAAASFLIARKQLRVARTDAGGYGLLVNAYETGFVSIHGNSPGTMEIVVNISAAGPGVWHNMLLYVGTPEQPVEKIGRYDSSRGPFEWKATVPVTDLPNMWWMVTWLKPHLEGNHTEALRCTFNGDHPLERWKWKQPIRVHTWFQNERRWWVPGSGRRKPLGKWKPQPSRPPDRAQSPSIPKAHSWPDE